MFGFFKKKSQPAPEEKVVVHAPIPPKPATGDQQFAAALYRELAATPGNLFFSPYSISACLTMVQAGAAGHTREELETALGHPGAGDALIETAGKLSRELAGRSEPTAYEKNRMSHGENAPPDTFGCHLLPANAIWHQTGYAIHPAFVEALKTRLGAEVQGVDFSGAPDEAVRLVNAWASKATRDKIREVLSRDSLDSKTRVLLANAIYFKARWEEVFSDHATQPKPFRLLDGASVEVPTMHQGGFYPWASDHEVQALQLNYTGGTIAMIVLLPDPGKFDAVSKAFDAGRLEGLIAAMTTEQTQIALPRFRVESTFLLGAPLRKLGMASAFTPQADFSRVSAEPGFALSEVIHKTYVDVNEKGTEAAAVTLSMAAGSAPPKRIIDFRVDRPFLFVIRDLPTKTPLFVGRVVDPRPGSVK